jgi:hypothetical protein
LHISPKAEEEKLYRILSGANVRSDIDAGISLAKMLLLNILRALLLTVLSGNWYARYMGVIRNTNCRNRRNPMEITLPIRPPMLPFSKSKIVLMTPADILANRPAPPPSTKSVAFATELAEVKTSAEILHEQMRIVPIGLMEALYPPGHWNMIATESFVEQNFSEVRWQEIWFTKYCNDGCCYKLLGC